MNTADKDTVEESGDGVWEEEELRRRTGGISDGTEGDKNWWKELWARERKRLRRRILSEKEVTKSVFGFLFHFLVLTVIIAIYLLRDNFGNLGAALKENGVNYLYIVFCEVLLVGITYFYFLFEDAKRLRSFGGISLIFCILNVYVGIALFMGQIHVYVRPSALVALLVFVLIGRRSAIFMNIISALLLFIVDSFADTGATPAYVYSELLISFSSGMMAIFFADKMRTRFQSIILSFIILIPSEFMIFLLEISSIAGGKATLPTEAGAWQNLFTLMGFGAVGSFGSMVFFLALLPIYERMFNCFTCFRLRELTGNDARLLQQLQAEAPGTYNHSVYVCQLATACAIAIGEDVDMTRAAAMYHDVGKLREPKYFTENQDEYNLHDELTPELSADIIRAHTRDGYDLIRAHHLPEFLADVALEHHGTMPIRYFYAKAIKLTDGELSIESYSYTGPKPRTKIAAIIMICDASEAAVRAETQKISDKSAKAEKAESVVRGIIEERINLEQFSDCNITMKELTTICHAIVSTYTGVYHHRVAYPTLKYNRSKS